MTKSMARNEAEASDLSVVRQETRSTTHRVDILERKMENIQNRMNRMEAVLQRLANPQAGVVESRNMQDWAQSGKLETVVTRRIEDMRQSNLESIEGIQLMRTSEGNLKFPSTGPIVVVTGWGEDPLPHACTASPTLDNLNPTTAARGVSEEVVPEQGERFNHPITISYPSTHNLPKDIMPADLDWLIDDKHAFIEGVVLNTLDKQIRHFTGSGNTPMVYPLKPVIEEIQKSDLAQLYVVGRADKRLRCTGLFWKLPPWPDFCAMSGDSFAQHCGYQVIESLYSVKQYNHSVLDYPDKFEELVKIWLFVNETASELTKTSIEPVFEQYRLLVIASLKFSKLTLGTVAPQFTGILIIGDCKVESSAFPLNTEDTISETRYPADNWNSCQFALSNGLPVLNNQSVPQGDHEYLEDIMDTGARELELKEFLLSVMKEVKDNHMLNQCYLRSGQTLKEWVCPTDKLCIFANVRGERIISMDVKCCYIVADESVLRLVEKLHLGEYEWNTYSEAFNRACNFASGIVKMGHQLDSRAAIFSDTRAEWIIAAQGCFRQKVTIVTIYASLGEVALVHSLNETQVSTLRCDSKQLKKLPAISSMLQNVRHFIYIEDEPVEADTLKQIEHLTTLSSSEVEEFGKTSHTTARLPSSTGLPKGVMIIHGNMVATTAAVMTIVPKIGTGDVHLAYFLLAHALELAAETVMLASGVAIGYGSALTRTDTRAGEAERGITIKSIGISLCYEMTEESLKSYKSERIRPVFTVNKMDIYFLELQVKGEEAYQIFSRIIENANVIIATNEDLLFNDVQDYPVKETVAFFAGFHVWAFTLSSLVKMYASKFGVEESKMMERLWGENFFDPTSKKWTTKNTGSATCKRGFVQVYYEPIKQIIKTCRNDQKDKLWPMSWKLGVTLKIDEELMGKALIKSVLQTWLPASNALLEMMILHLHFPSKAQKYHVENLYEEPHDDIHATAIRNYDLEGSLMFNVSKMISVPDKGRFLAFGNVFSREVVTDKKDLCVKNVQSTAIWRGKKRESDENIPCGNTVVMVGLYQFITRNAILTDEKVVDTCPIRTMEFPVFPVVRVAVQCKFASDFSKLVESLESLAKPDLMVFCTIEDSGEHSIARAGELHLDICLKDILNKPFGKTQVVSKESFLISTLMPSSHGFTYSTLLEGYCKDGRTESASALFKEMLGKGIHPGAITYGIMLEGLFKTGRTVAAKKLFKSLKVVYKLRLPEGVGIYPVFHVSQLNIHCGSKAISNPDLSLVKEDSKLKAEPKSILENSVVTQWLILWENLPPDDTSREDTYYFKGTFPELCALAIKIVGSGYAYLRTSMKFRGRKCQTLGNA